MFGVNEAELAADVARKLRLGGIAAAQAAAQAAPPQPSSSQQPGGGPRSRGGSAGAGGGPGGGGSRGEWNSAAAPPESRGGAELILTKAGLREVPREVWDAGPSLTKLDLSGNPVGGCHGHGDMVGLTAGAYHAKRTTRVHGVSGIHACT